VGSAGVGGWRRGEAAGGDEAAMPTSKLMAAARLVVERMPRLPTRKKPAPAAPTMAPKVLTA
jgi:hypothetical protein